MSTIDFDNVRLSSAGGIPHKVVGGLRLSGDIEKLTAELDIIIRAIHFDNLLEEMFPQPNIISQFVRQEPRMYLLNAPYLRLKSFRTNPTIAGLPQDPFHADDAAPSGTYGKLMSMTLVFETMQESDHEEPDEGNPETFLEHSVDVGAELLHISPKGVDVSKAPVMGSNGSLHQPYQPSGVDGGGSDAPPDDAKANNDPDIGIYKVITTIQHSLKWKFALNPDWTAIYDRLGTVNRDRIKLFENAKPETVLFTGLSGQRTYRYFKRRVGVMPWSLDFKFAQRIINESKDSFGWNHVYSPSKNCWVRLLQKKLADNQNKSKPLYETSDFTLLFRSATS